MTTTSTRLVHETVEGPVEVACATETDGRRLAPAGRAVAIVMLSLLLAAFLDADSLVSSISEEPFGTSRSLELAIVNPIKTISHWTGLNRPVQILDHLFKGHHRPLPVAHAAKPPEQATAVRHASDSGPSDAASNRGASPGSGASPVPRRTPTSQHPLKVWMAGDSLMGSISESLSNLVRHDPRFEVSIDFRIGTGLARPDVFDWAERIKQEITVANPDVVVLSFGTNDDQDMATGGHRVALGSAEWQAAYTARVNQILSIAATGTRQVVWLGIPAVRRTRLNHTKDIMNLAIKAAAVAHPGVSYLDTGPVLDTPSGGYTTYLSDSTGKPVAVRASDGIHLTASGANRVTPLIVAPILQLWGLPPVRP